jgi:hypothetical protein
MDKDLIVFYMDKEILLYSVLRKKFTLVPVLIKGTICQKAKAEQAYIFQVYFTYLPICNTVPLAYRCKFLLNLQTQNKSLKNCAVQ